MQLPLVYMVAYANIYRFKYALLLKLHIKQLYYYESPLSFRLLTDAFENTYYLLFPRHFFPENLRI